ncbi:MAG: hypothetical protein RLZZ280_1483, partial [Pseudomonadota bacterium]
QTPEQVWAPIRASMDEAGRFLLSKTRLDADSPLSDWLMPAPAPMSMDPLDSPRVLPKPAVDPKF